MRSRAMFEWPRKRARASVRARGVQGKLVVKEKKNIYIYIARKRDWCSKMTQVTNRKAR